MTTAILELETEIEFKPESEPLLPMGVDVKTIRKPFVFGAKVGPAFQAKPQPKLEPSAFPIGSRVRIKSYPSVPGVVVGLIYDSWRNSQKRAELDNYTTPRLVVHFDDESEIQINRFCDNFFSHEDLIFAADVPFCHQCGVQAVVVNRIDGDYCAECGANQI